MNFPGYHFQNRPAAASVGWNRNDTSTSSQIYAMGIYLIETSYRIMHLCPFIMLRMITVCKFYDIRRLSEEFIIEIMQIEFWIVIARWCEIERKISLKESSFDVAVGEIFFSYFFFILLIKLKSEKWNQAETAKSSQSMVGLYLRFRFSHVFPWNMA